MPDAYAEPHANQPSSNTRQDGETDEIDAEFARRVAEHIRQRREAAAGTAENVSRGTSVLKVLCAKLKSNLEEQMAAARG